MSVVEASTNDLVLMNVNDGIYKRRILSRKCDSHTALCKTIAVKRISLSLSLSLPSHCTLMTAGQHT